jgi:ATP-dependent DNA ligase
LDGYRAVAVKSGDAVTLYSRNRKLLNKRFPYIVEPLRGLPVDGEIVALDRSSISFRTPPARRTVSSI